MAERLFDKLEQEAFRAGIQARTKESMSWFRSRVSNLRVSRVGLLAQGPQRARHSYGRMYNFQYDPKMKTELPYYDRFPLCIPIQRAKGGFHGINLHYLHPVIRAQFLDALMLFASDQRYSIGTKMKLTYNMMKGSTKLRWFKPCFKHYLSSHIQSPLLLIEPADWEIAIFLPTDSFRKVDASSVWGNSRKMV
jgi:hypothetical protein|tara:strand:- start:407 stop:985 length:579 start_codon:yes stop_codon:yes gene_type:complete